MLTIFFGSLFINLLIIIRVTTQPRGFPVPCEVWVTSNSSNMSMSARLREDVYEITDPRKNPYAVVLFCKTHTNKDNICSGTLVSLRWVVTATHCLKNCKYTKVYAGGKSLHEIENLRLPHGSQLHTVDKLCGHEHLDVTLARVSEIFKKSPYVDQISLPKSKLPAERSKCEYTAFGRIQLNEDGDSCSKFDYKRKTQKLDVVYPCDCYLSSLRNDNWKKVGVDGTHFVCSIPKEDYGVCGGDSGSGLVCNREIQGITSSLFLPDKTGVCTFNDPYSRKSMCGSKETSSVFVAVFPIINWIKSIINREEGWEDLCYNGGSVPVASGLLIVTSLLVAQMYSFN